MNKYGNNLTKRDCTAPNIIFCLCLLSSNFIYCDAWQHHSPMLHDGYIWELEKALE